MEMWTILGIGYVILFPIINLFLLALVSVNHREDFEE